ncbi:MAG: winged helix-turn-helix transcriptional regulator [Clostridia bacterium]|nr:winged helix-turn-helix transcriptional regulator [Clostridia bacterium]
MLHIRSLREGLPLFRALNSDIRISIMELLYQEGPLRMSAISDKLGITAGALTPHIKALTDCGMITVEMISGKHGVQKVCCATDESIMIEPTQQHRSFNIYETEIGVGQFTAYEVSPTCGICTPEKIIGVVDDPRFFASPERFGAEILWFGHGYVEYMLPCFLQSNQELVEIQLSMEISSEAPGCSEDWPSDVHFSMNGVELGYWTSPGDFGRIQGIYNPSWWFRNWNQHGLYKLLTINNTGTYVDGGRISDTTLQELKIDGSSAILFRISVPENARNVGGLTIFGRSFGNYPQDIRMRVHYRDKEDACEK